MRTLRYVTTAILCLLGASAALGASYSSIINEMNALTDEYPEMVTSMDIGENDQGDLIYGIRIEKTDAGVFTYDKPKHLMLGVHHGNEALSATVSMRLASDLVEILHDPSHELYESLSATVMYVVPVLNISGYNSGSRQERASNGYTYDSNRDYPDACTSSSYYKLKSTAAISDFIEAEGIVGAVTAHGYIGTFTYPFGMHTSDFQTMDHDFFVETGKEVRKINGYRVGTHGDIVYPASSTFEDWAYYTHGIWATLLELKRSANIGNDSAAMLKYFSMLPPERSMQHDLTGSCTRFRAEGLPARP